MGKILSEGLGAQGDVMVDGQEAGPEDPVVGSVVVDLQHYREACKLPVRDPQIDKEVVRWIRGGNLAPHLELGSRHNLTPDVFRLYMRAQMGLLLNSDAFLEGGKPKDELVNQFGETFDLLASERIGFDPKTGKIVLSISEGVTLTLAA